MGRPSKLTDRQWEEIRKRLIAGEKMTTLAREYGVGVSRLSERFSEKITELKIVAERVVKAEDALKTVQTEVMSMPISERLAVIALADDMRTISTHLSGAARFGAATAHRLAGIANAQVDKIDDVNPMESQEVLQGIAALTKLSNESAKIGIDLINASKRDPLPDTSESNKITGFRVVAR